MYHISRVRRQCCLNHLCDLDDDDGDDNFPFVTLKQTVRENGRVMSTRARESTVRAHPHTWEG